MIVIFILILFLSSSCCLQDSSALVKELIAFEHSVHNKSEFAVEVVKKIQHTFEPWYYTVIFCDYTYFENRIIKYTQTFNYGYPVMLLDGCPTNYTYKSKVKPRIDTDGKTLYIVSSYELSSDLNEMVVQALINTGIWKPRSPVVFVISTPVEIDDYFNYSMRIHFQLLWSRSIGNSLLMVWTKKSIRIYMYNPFFDYVYEVTNRTDIVDLMERQYNNLNGYKIRLSVFRKSYVSDESGLINCHTNLAQVVLQYLNATCVPYLPRDGSTVGDLLENGTATGVTADLIDHHTEMELNSRILKSSYYGYIDTTYPLSQDHLCFLVKKSEKQSTFMTTIKLMKTKVWAVLMGDFITLTLVAIVAFYVERNVLKLHIERRSMGSVTMDIVKCFIRQTVDIKFLGPVFRIVVLMIIMYSLIVDCAIDGILTSAITYPRYKPDITTLKELRESNLTIAMHNRHTNIIMNRNNEKEYNFTDQDVKIFNDDKFKEAIEKRQFQYALLMRKSDAENITSKSVNIVNGRPLYHVVDECLIPCSIVYGLQYGSPYLNRINKILFGLTHGGILDHWISAEEFKVKQNSKLLYTASDQDKKALNMDNLAEVFYLWLAGLFISFIAFLVELTSISVSRNIKGLNILRNMKNANK